MKATMKKSPKTTDWMILAGLLLLSAVPVLAGVVRITQLSGGASINPDNARFFASPLPVVLHIVSVTIYSVLGAFQFAPGLRRSRPSFHRIAGRVLIPSGFVAALSGLWMTHFYPWPPLDGQLLYWTRVVMGFAMTAFLVFGMSTVLEGNFTRHGEWMTRAYAIGLGAGTQVFTHIPFIVFPGLLSEPTRALAMGAGWVINIAVAEWMIRRRRAHATRKFVVSSKEWQPSP